MHEHVHAVDLAQVRQAGVDRVWEGHILHNVLLPVLLVMTADQQGVSHRVQVTFGRAPLQASRCCRCLCGFLHGAGGFTSAVPCHARI